MVETGTTIIRIEQPTPNKVIVFALAALTGFLTLLFVTKIEGGGFTILLLVFLVGVLVGEQNGGAEADHVAAHGAYVDDVGVADYAFQFGQPALDEALAFARRVVFGVLRQVAVLAGFGDGADDGRALVAPQAFQFVLEPAQALRSHRNLFHDGVFDR